MNAKNQCLGWHLQTFKRHNSEEALIFKDFYLILFFRKTSIIMHE
jgi:hypothetical protein